VSEVGWIGHCIGSRALYYHTTKLELMLAKMDSFQEEMKINQVKTDANQAEMLARLKAKTDVNLKK
jgi:hypothetical protein